ncbi:CvpA family protein [Paenibacillus koleovorans]|uniref:CvpA family protein n=1 Tax=Paenibacillus koleovorans TaxID=121608 RepID=UPI000FD9AC63|nr:CvpA family protein [Paenibacillus koleovorans]
MHATNMLDIIVIVILAGAWFLGYTRGFIAQLVSVAGFFIAYLVAYLGFKPVAAALEKALPLHAFQATEQYAFLIEGLNLDVYLYNALAFTLLFVLTKVGLSFAGKILNLIARAPVIKTVNKWSGAILALLEAVLLIVIGIHVMSALPAESVQKLLADSRAAGFVIENMPDALLKLKELWSDS